MTIVEGKVPYILKDTAANWASSNPTLPSGIMGFETDKGRFKIGDGSTTWNNLHYTGVSTPALVVAASDASDIDKARANYICDGTDDDVEIQAAIDALPATGGKVLLSAGNFALSAIVSRDIDNVVVEGQGKATYLANDGSTKQFNVGRRAGWAFRNFATDAGGVNLGFDEQADIRNCWFAGQKRDNRIVGAQDYITTLASSGYQGTHDVVVQGDYAYAACYQDDAFHIIDISDPESPSIVSTLTDGSDRLDGIHDVIVDGDYAFVTAMNRNSIVSIDISDKENPAISDEVVDAGKLNQVHALSKQGNYIYAGGLSGDYFCIIDATDPTDMSLHGYTDDDTYLHFPRGTYPKGDYVYVATKGGGYLTVMDVSTKSTPVVHGYVQIVTSPTNNDCANLRVKENYAYVTTQDHDELVVVDISDPASPSVAYRLSIDFPYYITLAGNYAFISTFHNDKVYVVDISNPLAPFIVNWMYSADLEAASGMAIKGNYIFTAPRDPADTALVVAQLTPAAKQTRTKIITATRDLSDAAGDVQYTGVGFVPSSIEVLATDEDDEDCWGRCDEDKNVACIYNSTAKGEVRYDDNYLIYGYPGGSDYQRASVKSFDSDGFTLTWSKTGSPTGTMKIIFTCRR